MTELQAAIVAEALAGTPPRLIADRRGLDRETVYAAIQRARSTGTHIPRFKAGPPIRTQGTAWLRHLPRTETACLRSEASLRGYPDAQALAVAILQTVCRDGLFDAVLDGGA